MTVVTCQFSPNCTGKNQESCESLLLIRWRQFFFSILIQDFTSGWSVTRKTEKPTENSKTRTEPKPKITDFSKTEPNRNRIQKPRLTEKGHFWNFWVKSRRKSEKILRFQLGLLKKHSNPKKFLQKCCKLSYKHLLTLLKKCRILSQFLSTNADG